jgi:fatty-acyl-CoA synthase
MPVRLPERASEAYEYPLLIRHLLHTPLASQGDQEIVHGSRSRYTYRTFARRIARLANVLAGLGVEPGTTVAVMDWDSHRYLESYFAVPMMGAVLLTVNVRLSVDQILYTLNHAGTQVLLVHRDFLPLLEKLRDRLTSVREVLLLQEEVESMSQGFEFAGEYETLLGATNDRFDFVDFDENALATTFYTTGTTGLPKAVSFTHRQLVLHTLAVLGAFASGPSTQSLRQDDVYMPLTPMFHVHAWGLPLVATVLGVKQVYPGRYEPDALLALRRTEGVTYSHCVPTILQMLLDAPASAQTDLRGWKLTIGGSRLPAALAERAQSRGMNVFAAYGMSETCPVLTVTRPTSSCKAGFAIPLVDLRVVDDAMNDVAHETPGEIVVRAPWLTAAYRGDTRASDALWRGGYLHTRDIGTLSENGCLDVRDRIKDVIKSGGEWISSLQLEDLIGRLASVTEVAVIGVQDRDWGERPLALVVPKPQFRGVLSEIDVKAHLERFASDGVIPRYAVPERVVIVEALQKTSVGKLDKKKMREQFDVTAQPVTLPE